MVPEARTAAELTEGRTAAPMAANLVAYPVEFREVYLVEIPEESPAACPEAAVYREVAYLVAASMKEEGSSAELA